MALYETYIVEFRENRLLGTYIGEIQIKASSHKEAKRLAKQKLSKNACVLSTQTLVGNKRDNV